MSVLIDQIPFRQPDRARSSLLLLAGELPQTTLAQLRYLLAGSPDPDRALDYLGRLRELDRGAFQRLARSAAGLQSLIAVFCHSRFLSEEALKRPEWLEELCDSGELHRSLATESIIERLEKGLPDGPPPAALLARFRRQQMLRILLRDVRGICSVGEVTEELSSLADAVLEVAYRRIRADLESRHGVPRDADGQRIGFSILAMGKLGGEELNYSSDIDLMFCYSGPGETDGPAPLSSAEFFQKLANRYTDLLCSYTPEGMCYRVDLRLRPDGRLGEVCLSLEAMRRYYLERGRDWELQMLIKARVAAGELAPGRALLEAVEPAIYTTTLDFGAVEAVSQSRLRIHEKTAHKRSGNHEIDVKLCRGGIRDIEFLVQCLQRLHGGRERWVRHGGTLLALSRLRDKALLSATEYARLATAYQFLRAVEHRLQFADDRQTHALPLDSEELDSIARRLPATEGHDGAHLLQHLLQHLEEVAGMYERVIHAQQPAYQAQPVLPTAPPHGSNLVRFLDTIAPGLAATLRRNPIARGSLRFEHFLEKIRPMPEWLQLMNRDAALARHVTDLFANSPFLSEELLRTPELLTEFALFGAQPGEPPEDCDPGELRRWFRREMFRTQCESICLARPVFETLEETSKLGERVIAAAYRLAVRSVTESHPPQHANYRPRQQLMVVALGRLGTREFDYGSDADLVFVLPNHDAPELPFWTRVAERLIDLVSAYTGGGTIFSIDTRLRPNGREGALVQTEAAFRQYFERHAQAWEGMAYMKSLAVAGDLDRATEFLNSLQEIDWRRYGQSGRSRDDLRKMRYRLEREEGGANPLKAGFGGFYDIDFALMYLRLRSAGIFFKQLNTPHRIDVVEKMGHIERADAAFLRDAATLYRATDHGLRLLHGHAAGHLPTAQMELDILTELVRRWTPVRSHGQPLPEIFSRLQEQTRDYFDRLFGR